MSQAKQGGETGLNGEFYKGGQFLPNTETTVRGMQNGANSQSKPRKQEIAPYVWQVAPKGLKSIYAILSGRFAKLNRQSGKLEFAASEQTLSYFNWTEEKAQDLISQWNNGERWI